MSDDSKRTRKRYDDAFKQDAVRTLVQSGRPVTSVAEELGIEQSNLHKWYKRFGTDIKANLSNQTGASTPEELKSLREEVASIRDTLETMRVIVLKLLNKKYL
ncbi:MAG TPA: transposase [Chitinispirillaceae bacterium]|nr:transposase [Chitinispirillaceae bacterium]